MKYFKRKFELLTENNELIDRISIKKINETSIKRIYYCCPIRFDYLNE